MPIYVKKRISGMMYINLQELLIDNIYFENIIKICYDNNILHVFITKYYNVINLKLA